MRGVQNFTLYKDFRFFASFPAAVALENGSILLVFRRARDQRSLFGEPGGRWEARLDGMDHLDCRSTLTRILLGPDFQPLEGPTDLPSDTEAGDQDASLLVLSDGRLLLGGFAWYPFQASLNPGWAEGSPPAGPRNDPLLYQFWGSYVRFGDEKGQNWCPHRYLPGIPDTPDIIRGRRPFHGGSLRGRPLELPDGRLLVATYGWGRHGRAGYDSHLHESADGGLTWRYKSLIASDPEGPGEFAEPALHRAADGEIVALHRTRGLQDRLVTVRSRDEGATWGPWDIEPVVGHPYDIIDLEGDRALLVYGYRHKPYGIRARIIRSDCRGLAESQEIVLRDDGPCSDIGYPWATRLGDGRVLVVYYFCDEQGLRHIAGTVLA